MKEHQLLGLYTQNIFSQNPNASKSRATSLDRVLKALQKDRTVPINGREAGYKQTDTEYGEKPPRNLKRQQSHNSQKRNPSFATSSNDKQSLKIRTSTATKDKVPPKHTNSMPYLGHGQKRGSTHDGISTNNMLNSVYLRKTNPTAFSQQQRKIQDLLSCIYSQKTNGGLQSKNKQGKKNKAPVEGREQVMTANTIKGQNLQTVKETPGDKEQDQTKEDPASKFQSAFQHQNQGLKQETQLKFALQQTQSLSTASESTTGKKQDKQGLFPIQKEIPKIYSKPLIQPSQILHKLASTGQFVKPRPSKSNQFDEEQMAKMKMKQQYQGQLECQKGQVQRFMSLPSAEKPNNPESESRPQRRQHPAFNIKHKHPAPRNIDLYQNENVQKGLQKNRGQLKSDQKNRTAYNKQFNRIFRDDLEDYRSSVPPSTKNYQNESLTDVKREVQGVNSFDESVIQLDHPSSSNRKPLMSPSSLVAASQNFTSFDPSIANPFSKKSISGLNIEELELRALIKLMEQKFN